MIMIPKVFNSRPVSTKIFSKRTGRNNPNTSETIPKINSTKPSL